MHLPVTKKNLLLIVYKLYIEKYSLRTMANPNEVKSIFLNLNKPDNLINLT